MEPTITVTQEELKRLAEVVVTSSDKLADADWDRFVSKFWTDKLSGAVVNEPHGEWELISTAPKDGTVILGFNTHWYPEKCCITAIYWQAECNRWQLASAGDHAEDTSWDPTHWHSMPVVPAGLAECSHQIKTAIDDYKKSHNIDHLSWHDLVRIEINTELNDEECDYILWEHTSYPMGGFVEILNHLREYAKQRAAKDVQQIDT